MMTHGYNRPLYVLPFDHCGSEVCLSFFAFFFTATQDN